MNLHKSISTLNLEPLRVVTLCESYGDFQNPLESGYDIGPSSKTLIGKILQFRKETHLCETDKRFLY